MTDRKEYKVIITETHQKAVIVEASSEQEARTRARDAWKNGEFILDAECFQGAEFYVAGEADGDLSEKDLERIEGKDSVSTARETEVCPDA